MTNQIWYGKFIETTTNQFFFLSFFEFQKVHLKILLLHLYSCRIRNSFRQVSISNRSDKSKVVRKSGRMIYFHRSWNHDKNKCDCKIKMTQFSDHKQYLVATTNRRQIFSCFVPGPDVEDEIAYKMRQLIWTANNQFNIFHNFLILRCKRFTILTVSFGEIDQK